MSPSRGRPAGTEGDRHPDRMTKAIAPHLPQAASWASQDLPLIF